MRRRPFAAVLVIASLLLSSCGGGGGGSNGGSTTTATSGQTSTYAVPAAAALSAADVAVIIAQAVAEAKARGLAADIAVTDRVGNVLGLFEMTGAPATTRIMPAPNGDNIDAQGLAVPNRLAAIAKAVTAAYLSSGGNAFTTRTASEVVQQNFPPSPASVGLPGGPLFGVQFSQLPCSDVNTRYAPAGGAAALIGPKRSPLGLSADPGGIPLYKSGVLVGAIGVEGDGSYGDDPNILDVDQAPEEYAALAGTNGYAAPAAITADKITLEGSTLRFLDATTDKLAAAPASAPAFSAIDGSDGALVAVRGYYGEGGPALLSGAAFDTEASGVRKATAAEFSDVDGYVVSDGAGHDRFPIRAATDGAEVTQPLTQAEVASLLTNAFAIMRRTRSQIRNPLNSAAQFSIAVVDTYGAALGLVRAPDAPLFGTDVSLQKARTAAFFSGAHAGGDLAASSSADVQHFVAATRSFFGDQTALTGKYAFSDRAIGNIARPDFPDGQAGAANGPLARPIAQFNPFSTGLQSALIVGDIVAGATYAASAPGDASVADVPARCGAVPDAVAGQNRIQNGIQIFAGSMPIYRGNTLVGGIGVSGDGADQDELAAFLGLYGAAQSAGSIGEAPAAVRADQIVVQGVRLRYVSCPVAPFLDTADQNVCDGK